jgi:hypothetical protein
MPFLPRVTRWIRRYTLAEIAGIGTALAASAATLEVTGNVVVAAYAGTVGENLGFYGVMIAREAWADRRAARQAGRPYDMAAGLATAARLLFEFGPAELLDSALLRPLAMGLGIHFIGGPWGVVAGKLAADVTFYLPVIASYELRERLARTREEG